MADGVVPATLDIDEVLEGLTHEQMQEWMAFTRLYPFGWQRFEQWMGMLVATVRNAWSTEKVSVDEIFESMRWSTPDPVETEQERAPSEEEKKRFSDAVRAMFLNFGPKGMPVKGKK